MQIKGKITINYHYRDLTKEVLSNVGLMELLETEAMVHAFEMIKDGYSSGELNCYDENENQYIGWWSVEKEGLSD